MHIITVLISLAGIGMLSPAQASGATPADTRGAPMCVTCHGEQGEGMPDQGFPRLAGLNEGYLQTQLDAFANGERVNETMTPIARLLNKDDRAALARHFAGLKTPSAHADPAINNPEGERLALKGRWSQGLPACTQCHGTQGAGVGASFPALAGQSARYIENQLHAWQEGTRTPGPLGLMPVIALKLSAEDIKAVAGYFSALPAYLPSAGGKR